MGVGPGPFGPGCFLTGSDGLSRRNRRALPTEPVAVTITGLSHDGRGVAAIDAKKVFVHGALPGERVVLRITDRKRRYDEAEALEIVTAAPHRVAPRCPHFGLCGGCALQHLDAAQQLVEKQTQLLQSLERIGHVVPGTVLQPLAGPHWHYRRRARLSVRYVHKKERLLVGFRERKGRYVADIAECHVLDERVAGLLAPLTRLIEGLHARETLPQIEVACGDRQCALVLRHLEPLASDDVAAIRAFARHHRVAMMLQSGGPETVVPLEPEAVVLDFDIPRYQLTLEFGPADFIQVNAVLNQAMIDQALQLLEPSPNDRVLDLFCGLGNFTLPLARVAGSVVGVEGDPALVAKARANAARNGLENVDFYQADLAADLTGAAWLRQPFDQVLIDPPRCGAEMMLDHIAASGARRLVYVSCHPASLARDAGLLSERHHYRLQAAGVMDMFPHTGHVESIALFERRS